MSKVYKTDLDYSIVDKPDLTPDELLKYVRENFYVPQEGAWTLPKVLRFLQLMCKLEKVKPSIEQYVYILCNKPRLLNEACAGAGKTTMSKYKMAIANVCYGVPGRHIIAIAYNRHAALDIEKKYQLIARRVNESSQGRIHIDTDIKSTTMHAWCLMWVDEYKLKFKIRDIKLLETEAEQEFMKKSLMRYLKAIKNESIMVTDNLVGNLVQLNNWIRETLSFNDPQEWHLCSARAECGMLSATDLTSIFENYKKTKQLLGYQDYQDLIQYMWELLQDPEIVARIRRVHKYFVVDEYQDITPSMLRILKLIMEGDDLLGIERFNEGTLVCIGDGDQSIYGFRGTDSENCIRFKETYPEAVITAMSINRRCDKSILDYARKIIESNVNRIEKPIRGLHEGGNVEIAYYNSEVDEIRQVIDELRQVPLLRKTCVCYRNLLSSQFLVVKLLEAGIPMNIGRGIEPFTDIYSRSIEEMLELLEHSDVPLYAEKTLYKFIPRGQSYTKDAFKQFFRDHAEALKTSRRGHFVEAKQFWEYDYGTWHHQRGFDQAIENLHKAHTAIKNNQNMSVFMPVILEQLRKYYIDALRKNLFSDKLSDEYIKFIERYYTQNIPYKAFKKERNKLFEDMKTNRADGVYLTTMHGLKGLEFDNVIVLDMDDNLYPGNELKNNSFSEEQRAKIEWEARRLLYVTVTRAKHNLKLYFNSRCPSRYIKFFVESDDLSRLYGQADIDITSNHIQVATGSMIQQLSEDYADDEFILEDDIPSALLTTVAENEYEKSQDSFDDIIDDIYDSVLGDSDEIADNKAETNLFGDEQSNVDEGIDFGDSFDDVLTENPQPKQEKPWLENPESADYKPKLTTLLDMLRNTENGDF